MQRWLACALAILVMLLGIALSRGPAVLPGYNNLPTYMTD
jgi:hypothetical protein